MIEKQPLRILCSEATCILQAPPILMKKKKAVVKAMRNLIMENKKRFVLLAVVLALIVVAATVAFAIFENAGKTMPGGLNYDPDENAKPWSGDIQSADEQKGIKIPGYGEIYFQKDTDVVPITLYNPRENDCLFVFELYIDDAEEPFCTTGSIKPGDAVTEISTGGGIAEGTYTLRIKVLAFDEQTGASLNNAVVKTVLNVV